MDGAVLPQHREILGALGPSGEIFKTQLGAMIVDDCLIALRRLPADSVDLVVTSPPYRRSFEVWQR